jgi:alkylated DNA nucleotide flippase Atl1
MTTNNEAVDQQSAHVLLEHIARYRLSTFAAISRLQEFAGVSPRRVRRLLHQCRDAGELSSAALHHGVRYWFLTPNGAQQCGLDVNRSGPLSETAKIRAYAMLAFCCLTTNPRYRLMANDLYRQFPVLHRTGMPSTYYFDPGGSGCIGLARVDVGQRGRWDRIIQSLRDDIALHLSQPGFRQLIQASRFEITVLTVMPAKARRMASTLQSLPDVKHVPVHVVAQLELLPLVYSCHRKEAPFRLPRHGFHRSRPRSTEKQRASKPE